MNSSHLFPTKEAEVETSHSNLPYYGVPTGIDVFPAFVSFFKCISKLKRFNKHWSTGEKTSTHNPLQMHLELN